MPLPLADVDASERLSADDMATRREGEFLTAALRRVAQQAAQAAPAPGGRCLYCRAPLAPEARYCDDDCQADHAHELGIWRRQGRRA